MLKKLACVACASVIVPNVVFAQTAPTPAPSVELPPVVVEGTKAKKQPAKSVKSKAPTKAKAVAKAPPAAVASPPVAQPAAAGAAASAYQAATGPIDGFAATSSATGSKTGTPIVETPQSISVVGRGEMEARGSTTMEEALAYTPGVRAFASTRSRFLDEFFVRGFDTSTGNLGQLRDGLKLQPSVYDGGQEAYGMERIEVLKGASSILYGQLNPGGTINSISKRPTFTPQGEVNVTGGSFDNGQISADISGPINPQFAYRLTALARDSDTWIDHIDDDRRYVAPAFTFKPSDATTLTLLGYYQESRTQLSAPLDYFGTVAAIPGVGKIPKNRFIGEPDFDRFDINSGAVGYLLEHEFTPDLTLRSGTRYYEARGTWDYLTYRGINPAGVNGPAIVRGVSSREEHSTNWVTDNSLEYRFDTGPIEHTVLAGVDYGHSVYDTHRLRGNAGGQLDLDDPDYGAVDPIVPTVDSGFNRTLSQVGIYFQDQLKVYDRFVFVAGGRQDWVDSETEDYRFGDFEQQDSAFSGRLGAVYLGPWGFSPFVSYSESFSPTIAAGYLVASAKPTTGEQYEAGIRWQSADKRTLISAAAFTIDQANVVSQTQDFQFRQSGLVRSEGFEFEAKTTSGPLSAVVGYGYTDARIMEDELEGLIGQRRPGIPLNQAFVWLNYDFTHLGLRGLTLGSGVRYIGSTSLVDYNTGQPFPHDVPSYVVVDAAASLDLGAIDRSWKGYHLQAVAKNLLDEETLSCFTPVAGCDYGQPATFTGTMSYRW